MIRKKICNRILTSALVLAMVAGSVATGGTKTVQAEQYTNAADKDGTKDYIVVTKQGDDKESFSEELMEEYKNSETTSEVSENLSEKNNIAAVSLTDEEVEELRKDKAVDSLEEDLMVKACEVENSFSEADGGVISHSKGADSITHHPQRWKHAQKAVESAMKKYKDGSKCGTYADFSSATGATEYKLINIKEYMTETAESGQAKEYASVNANVGLSSNK